MLHIMLPDFTAHDVSFPKHAQPPKKKHLKKSPKKRRSQSEFSLLKREDGANKGEQCQRRALDGKKAKVGIGVQVSEVPKASHIIGNILGSKVPP